MLSDCKLFSQFSVDVVYHDPPGTADTILAKHDENYMPPEVAEALKKTGNWQGEGSTKSHAETYGQGSYP